MLGSFVAILATNHHLRVISEVMPLHNMQHHSLKAGNKHCSPMYIAHKSPSSTKSATAIGQKWQTLSNGLHHVEKVKGCSEE